MLAKVCLYCKAVIAVVPYGKYRTILQIKQKRICVVLQNGNSGKWNTAYIGIVQFGEFARSIG